MATNKTMSKKLTKEESVQAESIMQDLLDQLERNGTVGEHYIDLVRDYMDLWRMKTMLVHDIEERGVNVIWNNGGGQNGVKKNDSVELRIKVNAQMLKLLSELGIKPSDGGGTDEEM